MSMYSVGDRALTTWHLPPPAGMPVWSAFPSLNSSWRVIFFQDGFLPPSRWRGGGSSSMRHAGTACSKGIDGCRVAAHQVLTIFLIMVARRAFHFSEARWLPTSPGISAVTRPQALVGVDAATSHWPQLDRQGPTRQFSAQSCFQEVGRSSRSSWRSGPPLVSRLHAS
jgi:hypothetical protein